MKTSLKKFAINCLWSFIPLVLLALSIYILLSQNPDFNQDSFEGDMHTFATVVFLTALWWYKGLNDLPKRGLWLCFCIGLSILFVGMFFHISIWILLTVVIIMIAPIDYFCSGKSKSWWRWAYLLSPYLICSYGVCILASVCIKPFALAEEELRKYHEDPDSYLKTVVKDVTESDIYTDLYGITSFATIHDVRLEDIQVGDTVCLLVIDGKAKAVFYNSRMKNQNRENHDSYPETVVRDVRESDIYTDLYGITSFAPQDGSRLEDIHIGDTVRLWVVKGKVKAVFSNSRIKNQKQKNY